MVSYWLDDAPPPKADASIPTPPSTAAPGPRALLDADAAAAYLAVSRRYIYRLVQERRIAFVRLGQALRFRRKDLDDFVEANRTAAVRSH